MRRTKEWWGRLEKHERAELVALERAANYYGNGWNLPEGYYDCGMCGTPTTRSLCQYCSNILLILGHNHSPLTINLVRNLRYGHLPFQHRK